jgi:hypothetical protein
MEHYFDEKTGRPFFGLGRDRIFYLAKTKYPDSGLTRRKINRILQAFELVQLMNHIQRNVPLTFAVKFKARQANYWSWIYSI